MKLTIGEFLIILVITYQNVGCFIHQNSVGRNNYICGEKHLEWKAGHHGHKYELSCPVPLKGTDFLATPQREGRGSGKRVIRLVR